MIGNEKFDKILEKAENGQISPKEALLLLTEACTPRKLNALFQAASKVRKENVGQVFKFDGFIGSITPCETNPPCRFCSRSAKERGKTFSNPLSIEEVRTAAMLISNSGVKMVEIGGGTIPRGAGERVIEAVKAVNSVAPKMDIWVNVGPSLSKEDLILLKELGVKEVCSSLEVYDQKLFAEIKPGDSMDSRKLLAENINEVGLGLTSVMMVGVGATYRDYVEHMFWLKQFENLTHLPITGFRPIPGTPLENRNTAISIEVAKVGAVARLVNPSIDISFGGIMNDPQLLPLWVMAGANRAIHMGPHIHRKSAWSRVAHSSEIITESIGNLEYTNLLPLTKRIVESMGMMTDVEVLT